jgi:hypothetical protein
MCFSASRVFAACRASLAALARYASEDVPATEMSRRRAWPPSELFILHGNEGFVWKNGYSIGLQSDATCFVTGEIFACFRRGSLHDNTFDSGGRTTLRIFDNDRNDHTKELNIYGQASWTHLVPNILQRKRCFPMDCLRVRPAHRQAHTYTFTYTVWK